MATTSKAFVYIFNTPSEDVKVARVLSGRSADEEVELPSLRCFDEQTPEKIKCVQALLFFAVQDLHRPHHNVNPAVLQVFMASILPHFASIRQLAPKSSAVRCVEECAAIAGVTVSELLAWASEISSVHLRRADRASECVLDGESAAAEHPLSQQQAALISQLVELNKRSDDRLRAVEAVLPAASSSDSLGNSSQ